MEFDYIIVGGGSAGCVMASRLSEQDNVTVCLIEPGGPGDSIFIRAPALVAAMVSGRPKILRPPDTGRGPGQHAGRSSR